MSSQNHKESGGHFNLDLLPMLYQSRITYFIRSARGVVGEKNK
jgi:hypothetical protein